MMSNEKQIKINKGGRKMKKIGTLVMVGLLVAALAMPVLAWGPGRGGGFGGGPGSCWRQGGGPAADLSPEQEAKLDELAQKFENETSALRNEIRTKSRELNLLLNSATPDSAKAIALQRELSDLRAQMDQKRLEYRLTTKEIAPAQAGWFGGFMKGPGGRGPCWN
jgi:zinc resistance-associated protein